MNSKFKIGSVPHNKGIKSKHILKKIERFHLKLSIECKKHGKHFKWRLHTDNNVQCLFCASEWQMNQRRRNPLKFIYRDAKRHAKYHNREISINLIDLENLLVKQSNRCALTGVLFSYDIPPSLDRINSKLGYTKNNIQLIQIKINIMKSNLDEDHFIKLCNQIIDYSKYKKKRKKPKK